MLAGKVISIQEFQNKQQTYQATLGAVASKQAAVQSAQVNLDFSKVVAPIDGLAGLANYEVGSYVSPQSTQPLTTVVAIDPIKVVFQVGQDDYLSFIQQSLNDPSAAASNIREEKSYGMQMLLSDGTVFPQKGVFRAANNQISTQTGSITVEGLFPNPGMLLRPGLFARVHATIGMEHNALVVPVSSLITVQNLHQLAVVGPDNKVSIKNVSVGELTREEAIILSGVDAGDTIVVQGIQKMTDGCTVMPLPQSPVGVQQPGTPTESKGGMSLPSAPVASPSPSVSK